MSSHPVIATSPGTFSPRSWIARSEPIAATSSRQTRPSKRTPWSSAAPTDSAASWDEIDRLGSSSDMSTRRPACSSASW